MPKVLLVDDDPDSVRLLESHFQRESWETIAAGDGRTALNMAQAHVPDLVVLDIMVPLLDGIEVLRQLGYHRSTRRIPVIMVTAKHSNWEVKQARELGVKDYLAKPVEPGKLIASARKAMRLLPASLPVAA